MENFNDNNTIAKIEIYVHLKLKILLKYQKSMYNCMTLLELRRNSNTHQYFHKFI